MSEANPDGPAVGRPRRPRPGAAVVDSYRLAYLDEAPVNWCPALGTVLANEEVTTDGRSERGNHPVFRRPLKQWMLRITAYADRLLADLDLRRLARADQADAAQLDRPQRGRQRRASRSSATTASTSRSSPPGPTRCSARPTWCSRPSTRWSTRSCRRVARALSPTRRPTSRRAGAASSAPTCRRRGGAQVPRVRGAKSELERQAEGKEKTGVFTGAFATQPGQRRARSRSSSPTTCSWATAPARSWPCPRHDQRDFEFAREFDLPIRVRRRAAGELARASAADVGDDAGRRLARGVRRRRARRCNSANDGVSPRRPADAPRPSRRSSTWLEAAGARRGRRSPTSCATGCSAASATGASRSRSSTATTGDPVAVPESMLPVELPAIDDFAPTGRRRRRRAAVPSRRCARADRLGRRRARPRRRPADLPARAEHDAAVGRLVLVLPALPRPARTTTRSSTRRSSATGCSLPSTAGRRPLRRRGRARGAAPAVRALLAQGAVRPRPRVDARAVRPAVQPGLHPGAGVHRRARRLRRGRRGGRARRRRSSSATSRSTASSGRWARACRTSSPPTTCSREYGADTLRLYEMFMGPLDASRPWNTADIVGVHRFLQRLWRNVVDEETGRRVIVDDAPADDETRRVLHRTIAAVGADMADAAVQHRHRPPDRAEQPADPGGRPSEGRAARGGRAARADARAARPHVAEELWARLGHAETLAYEPFPDADPALLAVDTVEVAVQVNGKVRAQITVAADADRRRASRPRLVPTPKVVGRARGQDRPQGDRGARPDRQLRRGLKRWAASARSPARMARIPRSVRLLGPWSR